MDDARGKLVLEYIRVVRESLPVAFVMENVRGKLRNGLSIMDIKNHQRTAHAPSTIAKIQAVAIGGKLSDITQTLITYLQYKCSSSK
jgi:site-specific DNA-cytosine methylase